jgi:homoserine dehydrogenase
VIDTTGGKNMIKKQIVVGLLGFGNVGTGTYQALEMNR